MKLKNIILLLAFALPCFVAQAQEVMRLETAIAKAIENNYGIKIAAHNISIADNNNSWARAGKAPIVDLSGTFNHNITYDNNPASFLQGSFYNGSLGAGLSAAYPLYGGGRIKVLKQQLELAIPIAQLQQKAGINDLLRTVYQQYYTVIFQQERLKVLHSSFALSKDRLAYESIRRDYGTSNSFNLLQFENALLTDSINIVSQVQQVETAKRNLFVTLNADYSPAITFPEPLQVSDEEINLDNLAETLSEDNYTLRSLELLTNLDALNTQLAESARRPTINLTGAANFNENAFQFYADNPATGEPFGLKLSNRLNASVGAQLNWNLYDGGVRKTDMENARLQQEISQLDIAQARAQLTGQLNILADNYAQQRQLLALAGQQIELAQKNIDIALERFKSGQISSLDYRNIQLQYLNAAFGKVNAMYNLILTKNELDWLVGKYGNT